MDYRTIIAPAFELNGGWPEAHERRYSCMIRRFEGAQTDDEDNVRIRGVRTAAGRTGLGAERLRIDPGARDVHGHSASAGSGVRRGERDWPAARARSRPRRSAAGATGRSARRGDLSPREAPQARFGEADGVAHVPGAD